MSYNKELTLEKWPIDDIVPKAIKENIKIVLEDNTLVSIKIISTVNNLL